MAAARLLAVDIGAESGRVVAGRFDGERLALEEVHRFPNVPVLAAGTLHWDVLALFAAVLDGLRAAGPAASVGTRNWRIPPSQAATTSKPQSTRIFPSMRREIRSSSAISIRLVPRRTSSVTERLAWEHSDRVPVQAEVRSAAMKITPG